MTLLSGEKISKRFNDQIIFDQVSFTVNSGDKIGLVGKNGSGKTTLFEIFTHLQDVDSGVVHKSKNCMIDYAEQEKTDYLETSLSDYVASAREDLLSLKRKITRIEEALTMYPDDKQNLEKLGQIQNKYEHENGFTFESEIKLILIGLGFKEDRHKDRMKNFSGGEKNRASLARVLAGKGNLLLLDEPTNHLDIDSTLWLEEYLNKTDKSYIIVSHDRTFLGNTVKKVWEINHGKIEFYVGEFEKYINERAERRRLQAHHYWHQREEIERLEDFVRRHMAGQKTKQAQSKLKYLSRIKRIPPPKGEDSMGTIEVKSSGRSFAHVLAIEDVSVGYNDQPVVSDINLNIYRGDKIGLIGANGSGKSTLLKSLIGELSPISGEIRLGSNVDVAYFDQELSDLDSGRTVLENLWELDPIVEAGIIRSYLARFGFSGEDVLKMVSSLSGGEKTKLSLARLLYHPANFIIFDEPTNHLDIISREALEEALINYDGSFLIVSHDRYFLDKVVKKIFHLKDSFINIYDGNYSNFHEKNVKFETVEKPKETKSKQAYQEFKEKSRQRSRLKKDIQATEEKIALLEKELENVIEEINHKIPKNDWEQLQQSTQNKNKLEEEIIHMIDKLENLEGMNLD